MLNSGRTLFHLSGEGQDIPAEHITLGECLRGAGYHTHGVGKWHNGPDSYARSFSSGADIFFGGMWDHWNVPGNDFKEDGKYEKQIHFTPNFSASSDSIKVLAERITAGVHSTDLFSGSAVDYIKNYDSDQPFFMYLCTNDILVPRMPHERFRGKSPMGLRGEAILQFDETVRQVTDALRRLGLSDNTLLIITSDNGPVLDDGYADEAIPLAGDHRPGGPFRGGKYSSFEAGSIVPFIVHWPGHVRGGRTSDALVSQIDNVATLASLIGAEVPEGAAADSQDALKTWLGKSKKSRPFAAKYAANHNIVLRTDRWKFIPPHDGGPMITWGPRIETGNAPVPQLYDMRRAEDEQTNVAESNPKVVARMMDLLRQIQPK